MKFGLNSDQYKFIKSTIVDPLARHGARVFCYGSRARGDYRPFSDLDLMVESGDLVGLNLGELMENIQKSNFPFKVDIVNYSDFAESYKQSYQKDKILFD